MQLSSFDLTNSRNAKNLAPFGGFARMMWTSIFNKRWLNRGVMLSVVGIDLL